MFRVYGGAATVVALGDSLLHRALSSRLGCFQEHPAGHYDDGLDLSVGQKKSVYSCILVYLVSTLMNAVKARNQ